MVVKFKVGTTEAIPQPGGGPQGTLLGLLLFLILINSCGFDNTETIIGSTIPKAKNKFSPTKLHLKYVDDLTIMESFNLKESLVENPDRPLPDLFHARLRHTLPAAKSQVYSQISDIQDYAEMNQMRLNVAKFILFNTTTSLDLCQPWKLKTTQ